MVEYLAVFTLVDGLEETDMEPFCRLVATSRDEAEDEALRLRRPEGANFVKLFRDGQYEGPKLGFDL